MKNILLFLMTVMAVHLSAQDIMSKAPLKIKFFNRVPYVDDVDSRYEKLTPDQQPRKKRRECIVLWRT